MLPLLLTSLIENHFTMTILTFCKNSSLLVVYIFTEWYFLVNENENSLDIGVKLNRTITKMGNIILIYMFIIIYMLLILYFILYLKLDFRYTVCLHKQIYCLHKQCIRTIVINWKKIKYLKFYTFIYLNII